MDDVACEHSRGMGDHSFFSHTGSDGLAPGDRVRNAGYDGSAVGENIAAGQQSIDAVMAARLDSPGHCAIGYLITSVKLSHLFIGSIYILESTKYIYLLRLHIARLNTRLILLATPVSTF